MNKFFLAFFFFFLSVSFYAQGIFSDEEDASIFSTLYREGKYAEAIVECEKEITSNANNIDSYITLTLIYIALKDYGKAYHTSQRGRKVQQYHPRLIEMQAISCYHLGRNIESLNLLQTYLSYTSQEKDVSEIYYYMGEIYLRLSQYHHADIALSTAVSIRPFEVSWWARLGYIREKSKTYKYSLEAYEKALSFDKNYFDALEGKRRVLSALK
ncbi:MAG: tetratricopeptide repeat protein [Treponema sp.]